MCLIIFAHQVSPEFPLVVAANRDEFYTRPSQPAEFWEDSEPSHHILAGRDLVAGGTWLGMSTGGRFAAVTNIRDPSQAELKPRSRGELTRNYLEGSQTPAQYCAELADSLSQFAGFNLLIGDRNSLFYVNNFAERIDEIQPGIYGLSNGQLNSDWPKVTLGRARLTRLLERPRRLTTDDLLAMMQDREPAADNQLPATGIPRELERKLSSAFIVNSERLYGTLCSTGIIYASDGSYRFSEQNFDRNGAATTRHYYTQRKLAATSA